MQESAQDPYVTPKARLEASTAKPARGAPVGFGGWLILPTIALIFRPIVATAELLTAYVPMISDGTLQKLTSSTSASYHIMWAPLLALEVIYRFAVIGFSIYLMILFFGKSAKTPSRYVALLVAIPIFAVVDLLLVSLIPNLPSGTVQNAIPQVVQTGFAALVWAPYFLLSARVKNTFVH